MNAAVDEVAAALDGARTIDMKPYIGIKRVCAVPMNRADYNMLRGWQLPADENGSDEGYLVEYTDGGAPNMPHLFEGYVSWSPKDVFERAYREQTGLGSFSAALEALKSGYRVARLTWQERGTYLRMIDGEVVYASVNDETVTSWLNATPDEILADDWIVII